MRTHTIIRALVATLLAAGALAVAACGGDEAGGATTAADRQREAREAALDYARCMRENGVEMPDPTFEGGGMKQMGPENVAPAKLEAAEKACKKYLEDIEPPKLSDEQQQEFREAALAFARCMRENGIENFPDPQFGEGGRVTQALSKESGVDPEDADFKRAQQACQDKMPQAPREEWAP